MLRRVLVTATRSGCRWLLVGVFLGCCFSLTFVVRRFVAQRDKVRAEKMQAFADLQKAMARLNRAEKQERMFEERGAEMVRRGFESLEEMESAEASSSPQVALPDVELDTSEPFDQESFSAWLATEEGRTLGISRDTPVSFDDIRSS